MNLYDIVKITTTKLADLAVTTVKIADDAVSNAKIRPSTGLSVIGRSANSTGDVADIVASTDGRPLRRNGSVLEFSQLTTSGIADSAITATKLSGNQTGTAPIYGVRAWVVFNGTGTTGSSQFIDGSGNVTSVVKNGTGEYTITFTTALPNADYVCIGSTGDTFVANSSVNFITRATNSVTFKTYYNANTLGDFVRVDVAIIG
jgi:hypothetical protein